jgi:hypothetical protein
VFLALMLLRSVDSGCHLWEPLGTLFLLIKCDQVLLSISKARNDLPAVDTQAQEIFYSCFPLDVDYSWCIITSKTWYAPGTVFPCERVTPFRIKTL